MRLLVSSTELPPGPGGIGSHAHQLTAELVRAGWRATVLGPQDYVQAAEAEQWRREQPFVTRRLRHWPTPPFQGAIWGARMALEIARFRPDCLLATGQRATWLAATIAPRFRLPWLAVAHGTELTSPYRWQRRLGRWAFERADAVVSVSEYTRGLLRDAGIRPRRSVVIHNGADGRAFDAPPTPVEFPADRLAVELRPGARPAGRRLLLTVGRVSERKGQDLVVRALPEVLRSVDDVHYVAVGLPERGEQIRRLASRLGVAERVHLTGRLDGSAVRALLHAADLFVMPSRRTAGGDVEGFGIAAVEAALCGTPSVVSEGSGLVEAIVPGLTGLAVAPDEPAALARALAGLLLDDERRLAMAEQARERAWREQTWSRRVGEYDALLRSLAASRGAARHGRQA